MCVVIFDEDANLNNIEDGVVRIYSTELSQKVSRSKLAQVLGDAEHGKMNFTTAKLLVSFIA